MNCEMDTVELKDILPYIQPNCVALPDEMGMDYGRRAYIEFARRSGAVVRRLVYDLQDGIVDYPIEVPDGYSVSRINRVIIEGNSVISPTHDDIVCCYGWGGGSQFIAGSYSGGSMAGSYGYGPNFWCPCGNWRFRMDGYNCLILQRAPVRDCEHGLVIEVSLQPKQDVCNFEADFFDRWCEGIAYGALMRALMLPNTDWYNPQESTRYRALFNAEIQRAKHKFDLNYSRGPATMRAKRFV